jgi:hypothetical protein
VPGPVDEIGNDQEVAGEAHLHDGVRLELQARIVRRPLCGALGGIWKELLQAHFEAGDGFLAQEIGQGDTLRSRKIGQVALAEGDLQIAALGDFDRVLERFGKVGEKRDHLLGGLEILLFSVQARTPGVAEHVALGDTDARFVRLEVVAFEKLDRMRGHQRQLQLGRKIGGRRDQELLLRLPVALHFEIESVREELLPTPRAQRRLLEPALQQRFTDIAASSARKRDQTIDAHLVQHAPAELGTTTHARRQIGTRQ